MASAADDEAVGGYGVVLPSVLLPFLSDAILSPNREARPMKLYLSLIIGLFSAAGIAAQEASVTVEPVFIGTAQPIAVRLVRPAYPEAPLKVGLGGRISVAVTVDEQGYVITAGDADGPYPICMSVTDPNVVALRDIAVQAARAARFKPGIADEKPVKSYGRIDYIFTPVVVAEKKAGTSGTNDVPLKEMRLDRMTKIGVATPAAGASVDSSDQTPDTGQSPAGVLNGKFETLPKPPFPAAARAVHAGGAVSVQVLIVEDGSVYRAEAKSGHPLLRHAAEIAACGSKFIPTLLEGHPVKVSGIITYSFVP